MSMAILKIRDENGRVWEIPALKGEPGDPTELLDRVWPIGSIYLSVDATDPADRFGGRWTRIENAFLLAASNAHPAGERGGEEQVTLTQEQMPKHAHVHNDYIQGYVNANYRDGFNTYASPTQELAGGDRQAAQGGSSSAGGSQPHNNMPPYISVYVWQRTH
jgi:hypothetical protein